MRVLPTNRGSSSSRGGRRASPPSSSRCSLRSAIGWCASRSPPMPAAPCRSWPKSRTAPWRSRIARRPRARCRRCWMSPTRSRAPIGWRFRRPASTARWSAGRISTAMPAMPPRSRWRYRSTAASDFAANSSAPRATARASATKRPATPPAEILLRIDDMAEARLVLTDALIADSLRKSKQNQRKGD